MRLFSVAQTPHCNVCTTLLCLLIAALLTASPPVYAGKLGDTRSAVSGSSSRSNSGDDSDDDDDDDDNDDYSSGDDSDDSGAGVLACLIPFVLPFCLIAAAAKDKDNEGSGGPSERVYFLSYPYAGGETGRLRIERNRAMPPEYTAPAESDSELRVADDGGEGTALLEAPPEPVSYRRSAGRFAANYFYDLDGVHVPALELLLDTASRVGIETEWRLFLEPLPGQIHRQWMGRLDLNVRLIQTPLAEARWGFGGRILIDDGVWGGFDSGFSVLFFPVRPLNISADIHLGNLGRAFYFEGRAALGVSFNRGELFAGYRGALVQGRDISVGFHGPTAGAAVWF